jgi:hypothetical protein
VAARSPQETNLPTDIISIRVEFEDTYMNLTISHNMSLDHFKTQVREDMDFDTDVRLRVGYSTPQGWCLINSEATWVDALRNNIRTIQPTACQPDLLSPTFCLTSLPKNGLLISWTCPGQQMVIIAYWCGPSDSPNKWF